MLLLFISLLNIAARLVNISADMLYPMNYIIESFSIIWMLSLLAFCCIIIFDVIMMYVGLGQLKLFNRFFKKKLTDGGEESH